MKELMNVEIALRTPELPPLSIRQFLAAPIRDVLVQILDNGKTLAIVPKPRGMNDHMYRHHLASGQRVTLRAYTADLFNTLDELEAMPLDRRGGTCWRNGDAYSVWLQIQQCIEMGVGYVATWGDLIPDEW